MNNNFAMDIEIKTQTKEQCERVGVSICNQLRGNQDFIDSNIVVNYTDNDNVVRLYIGEEVEKIPTIMLSRGNAPGQITLERSKELLLKMIEGHGKNWLSGDWLDVEDTINYLFALDFTEEEILELGFCTEIDIDNANARLD